MASKTLEVRVTGTDAGATKTIGGVSVAADSMAAKLDATGKKLQSAGKTMSIGLTLPILLAARAAMAELSESQAVAAQTNAVIKSTGGVANVSSRDVDKLSTALLKKSGIDDELIHKGANLLLTFKNVRNEVGQGNAVFDRATKAALDLSVSGFGDMTATSKMLGKALNDPVLGLTALSKAGVTFSAEQKATIKTLAETGDVLGAQKIILKEVESQVGGAAAAYGDTLPGKIGRAREALLNSAGLMLGTAAPALEVLAAGAEKLATFLDGLPGPVKAVVAGLAAVVAVAGPVMFITGGLMRNWAALSASSPKLAAGIGKLGGLLGKLSLAGGFASLVMIGVSGSFGKADDNARQLEESLGRVGRLTDDKLVAAFERLSAMAESGFAEGFNTDLDVFGKLAETNIGTATRLRDAIAASGGATEKYDAILRQEASAQRQSAADTERANAALRTNKGHMEALRTEAEKLINTQLGVLGASLNTEQAINSYNDAVATSGANSLEARDAQLNLAQSVLAQGQAVYDNTLLTSGATSQAGKMRDATKAQIDTLTLLAGTLAPGSPLRRELDAYIFRLAGAQGKRTAMIDVDKSGADAKIAALRGAMVGIGQSSAVSAVGIASPFSKMLGHGFSTIRFHQGGVVPGPVGVEVPAILQGGEEVITAAERENRDSGSGEVLELHLHLHGDLEDAVVKGYIKGAKDGRFRGLHVVGMTTDS